jgi:hypothetical protein
MSGAAWKDHAQLTAMLQRLQHPSAVRCLDELEAIIWQDNRRGLLAGTDRDDAPMVSTVREQTPVGHWVTYILPNGVPAHYYQAGLTGLFPEMDGSGKPLVPHGAESRAITNLATDHTPIGPNEWLVYGAWVGVVSKKDVQFLPFHFRGEGRLPVRDLAGLRPQGLTEAQAAIERWGMALLNGTP